MMDILVGNRGKYKVPARTAGQDIFQQGVETSPLQPCLPTLLPHNLPSTLTLPSQQNPESS